MGIDDVDIDKALDNHKYFIEEQDESNEDDPARGRVDVLYKSTDGPHNFIGWSTLAGPTGYHSEEC